MGESEGSEIADSKVGEISTHVYKIVDEYPLLYTVNRKTQTEPKFFSEPNF